MADFSNAAGADPYPDLSDATSEELESQVQRARAELAALQERQNQIEQEKHRLKELSRRQEELEQGRTDIVEKLNHALSSIEASTDATERRLEQLNSIYKAFKEHLQGVVDINPRFWSTNDLPKELNRALSLVENARSEYSLVRSKVIWELNEHMPSLEALVDNHKDTNNLEIKGFFYWLKSGFAFTLPLMIFGILTLVAVLWILGKNHH